MGLGLLFHGRGGARLSPLGRGGLDMPVASHESLKDSVGYESEGEYCEIPRSLLLDRLKDLLQGARLLRVGREGGLDKKDTRQAENNGSGGDTEDPRLHRDLFFVGTHLLQVKF